jgi:hypothetical protein
MNKDVIQAESILSVIISKPVANKADFRAASRGASLTFD